MSFFKEILNPWRIFKVLLLFFLFFGIIAFLYFFVGELEEKDKVVFGITFSQQFAEQMGLNWREVFLATLDDLEVRRMRLIAYWEKIEPENDQYYFDDLDWQIREAKKRGVSIILAVGRRLPRWPECHYPEWAKGIEEKEQQEEVLDLINEIVLHYQNERAIKIWQIENEPFLISFGECPPLDEEFLDKEISLVRKLDLKKRPIMLTASGELSSWIQPAIKSDILGTSLYRSVWNELLGHYRYPIPSIFYYKRANMVKWVTGIDKIILIELQAEPWGPKMIYETPIEKQNQSMNHSDFEEMIGYAKKTGFDEAYLWGVEWWYQRKIGGDPFFWNKAKELF